MLRNSLKYLLFIGVMLVSGFSFQIGRGLSKQSCAPLKTTFRLASSKNIRGVQRMTAPQLASILKSKPTRDLYQIIDVRERNELQIVSLPDNNVIHLALGDSANWQRQVEEGTHPSLDKDKPTVCICHHGMRSLRMANFLVSQANFAEVYNLEGGIHAYSTEVDPSLPQY